MTDGPTCDTLIVGCHIACIDAAGSEYTDGYITIADGRITTISEGPAPDALRSQAAQVIDATGMLATPGLINTHHHLFQWLTRGHAADKNLFGWLTHLYPTWKHIDAEATHAAANAGLTALALSGCTLTTDHHYLFPKGSGDLLGAAIESAQAIGLRFHPCRGSMNLGESSGGLPPDEIVESHDEIMAATETAINTWHDPADDAMLQIAVAPCAPFSVTRQLMIDSATLAREKNVRLHTHLAETVEENAYCLEHYGIRPVEFLEQLNWLGPDVWLAHCVHLNDAEICLFAKTGTTVAHCPSSNGRLGCGIAPVRKLTQAGCHVGLGVDGAASNEAGELMIELRESLLYARLADGPEALAVRDALTLGTINGAHCLGRQNALGSLETGKLADIVLWDMTSLAHDNIIDPIAALVLGPPRLAHTVLVAGKKIVDDHRLVNADVDQITTELAHHSKRILSAGSG